MIDFPYRKVFELIEKSLIESGSSRLQEVKIRSELDSYDNIKFISRTDNEYFHLLVMVTFYSGFRASTVKEKEGIIKGHFPDWQRVSNYGESDVVKILADDNMIRHRKKIRACINNAKRLKVIIGKFGSVDELIRGFEADKSLENLLLLKEFLEETFNYLGGVTVYHFMTDIGLPVLKPDRVVCRVFQRLGLIDTSNQLLKTVLIGRKFSEATGRSIRYIDIVMVAYGQLSFEALGVERGICLLKPRCELCKAREYCNYKNYIVDDQFVRNNSEAYDT